MWRLFGIILHLMLKSNALHAGKTTSKCINACLAPIASLDGCSIVTVEGLGNCFSGFNPVQGYFFMQSNYLMHALMCQPCLLPSTFPIMYSNRAEERPSVPSHRK